MKRFKKILFVNEPGTVVTSTSKAVMDLARSNNAKVTLLDVASDLPRTFVKLDQAFKNIRKNRLKSLMEKLDTSGIEVDYKLRDGIPFIEVIREIRDYEHDLLIKNSETRTVHGAAFGSNDLHLLRKCPCPVWIVTSDESEYSKSIMAAIDVDPAVEANAELNQIILELASSLAVRNEGKLHVVHALSTPNEDLLDELRGQLGNKDLEGALEGAYKDREASVQELIAEYCPHDLDYETHIEKDTPDALILAKAREHDIGVVVMGTVARTGISGFFIGNTAERAINGLNCSVLTVKPQKFQTPVH